MLRKSVIEAYIWALSCEFESHHNEKHKLFIKIWNFLRCDYDAIGPANLEECDPKSGLLPPCDLFLQTGRFHSEFHNLQYIGMGGFGHVYKARRDFDNTQYAIKTVPLKGIQDIEGILREVQVWAKLKSNYVVGYKSSWFEYTRYDDGSTSTDSGYKQEIECDSTFTDNLTIGSSNNYKSEADSELIHLKDKETSFLTPSLRFGTLFHIQMEYCDMSLDVALERIRDELGHQPSTSAWGISAFISMTLFHEILHGINYLHSRKPSIIHRDLKPQNVLIAFKGNDNFIKIGDFGLAKFVNKVNPIDDADTDATDEESYHTKGCGTQIYAAPEQLKGHYYDQKADIYSAGIILLEMLYRFSSFYEKINFIGNLKMKRVLPCGFSSYDAKRAIWDMTHDDPEKRPDCLDCLKYNLWPELTLKEMWDKFAFNKNDATLSRIIIERKNLLLEVVRSSTLGVLTIDIMKERWGRIYDIILDIKQCNLSPTMQETAKRILRDAKKYCDNNKSMMADYIGIAATYYFGRGRWRCIIHEHDHVGARSINCKWEHDYRGLHCIAWNQYEFLIANFTYLGSPFMSVTLFLIPEFEIKIPHNNGITIIECSMSEEMKNVALTVATNVIAQSVNLEEISSVIMNIFNKKYTNLPPHWHCITSKSSSNCLYLWLFRKIRNDHPIDYISLRINNIDIFLFHNNCVFKSSSSSSLSWKSGNDKKNAVKLYKKGKFWPTHEKLRSQMVLDEATMLAHEALKSQSTIGNSFIITFRSYPSSFGDEWNCIMGPYEFGDFDNFCAYGPKNRHMWAIFRSGKLHISLWKRIAGDDQNHHFSFAVRPDLTKEYSIESHWKPPK